MAGREHTKPARLCTSPGTLRSLEYTTVLRHIAGWAGFYGRRYLRRLVPRSDLRWIRRRLRAVAAIMDVYEQAGRPSLRYLPDVRALARRASIADAWLTPQELWTMVTFFATIAAVVQAFRPHRTLPRGIYHRIVRLPTLDDFRQRVRSVITPEGEILDDASPTLRRIAREWRQLRRQIDQKLRALMERPEYAPAIQDCIRTQREHRWVLLVRADQQHRIPGIVHGTSGSGASVYLEPLELVEWNNRYVILEEQRREEIHRILQELTGHLRQIPSWGRLFRRLAWLDALLAIAAFAYTYDCQIPEVRDADVLEPRRARHPILVIQARRSGSTVVPLDLTMRSSEKVLIITGPNAGGKTVALKTVGLLTVMAHAGLPIPAASDTVIPLCSHVMADIGDRQDILQNLSTFASHMRRIVPMLTTDVRRGLYLIDELGTGTDPVEGAALGIAILHHLRQRPGKVIAVTHLTPIKMMAMDHPDVVTASMEFAPDTLEPTFRLIPHALGASHALQIARRLGMPDTVLREAEQTFDPQYRRWLDVIRQLEQTQHQFEVRLREVERQRAEMEAAFAKKQHELEQYRTALVKEWEAWKRRVQTWWDTEQQRWQQLLQTVEDPRLRQHLREQFRAFTRTFREQQRAQLRPPEALEQADISEDWQPGQTVRLRTSSTTGVIERIDRQRNLAVVQIAGKRMHVPLSWLQSAPAGSPTSETALSTTLPETSAVSTIHLLGLHIPEALDQLDRMLDRAMRAGLHRVCVIHGYRPGRLKRAVLQYLRRHDLVERLEPAAPREGGPGATIVYLRTEEK